MRISGCRALALFNDSARLANELKMDLILHARPSDVCAAEEQEQLFQFRAAENDSSARSLQM